MTLILDSFSGSGTTGHPILKVNQTAYDKEPRRFHSCGDGAENLHLKLPPSVYGEWPKVTRMPMANSVNGLGGSFRYCELGEPLFDESGKIRETVSFAELARHVYFTETGEPLPRERVTKSPFIGECRGVGIYLLFNGILGDKSSQGGNVLTRSVLAKLPKFDGQKVIYCAGCLLGKDRLQAERILVRQTPYEIKVS